MTENEKLLSAEQRYNLSRARRAARFVGLILPLVITVGGTLLLILWIPRMPDPAAVHWNGAGEPDGFGSPWMNVLGVGISSLVVTALYGFQGLLKFQKGGKLGAVVWTSLNRAYPAFILGAVVSMQASILMPVASQLDAAEASATGPVPWALPLGFGIGIAVGLLAFLLQPRLRIERPIDKSSAPLPLEETERAFWFGTVRPSAAFVWGGVAIGLATVAGTVVLMYAAGAEIWWTMLVLFGVLAFAAATSCWFHVRINEKGIEARSTLGWPTFRVNAVDVDRVTAAEIVPFAEFGGWGLRWVPGGFGIVMRTGEGIVVTRKDGRTFTVTIDDAETAAAVLAAAAKKVLQHTRTEQSEESGEEPAA